jgi:hypothetical protein
VKELFDAFFASPSGMALYALLAVAFLDFALGVFAALRDGTLKLDELAAFVRSHLAGRVLPIALLLVVGYAADQVALTAAGLAAGAAYVAETVGSIASSWGPGHDVQPTPTD